MRFVSLTLVLLSAPLCGAGPAWDTSLRLDLGPNTYIVVNTGPNRSELIPYRLQVRGTPISVDPITSTLLIDLDEDGVSEVLTEETTARGTGLLERAFRLYRVSPKRIHRILDEQSFLSSVPLPVGSEEQVRVFVRHQPSGSGVRSGVLALHREHLAKETHSSTCKAFRLEHGQVLTAPCP